MSSEPHNYTIFRIANEYFAVSAVNVIEIVMVPKVTFVPLGQPYMKGLFNHRGRILSLVDTSIRLNLPKIAISEVTPVLVLKHEDETKASEFGILVQSIEDIIAVKAEEITPSPSLDTIYDVSFIDGIFKYRQSFVTILNLKKTFAIT